MLTDSFVHANSTCRSRLRQAPHVELFEKSKVRVAHRQGKRAANETHLERCRHQCASRTMCFLFSVRDAARRAIKVVGYNLENVE